jgi:hypothetical protein
VRVNLKLRLSFNNRLACGIHAIEGGVLVGGTPTEYSEIGVFQPVGTSWNTDFDACVKTRVQCSVVLQMSSGD